MCGFVARFGAVTSDARGRFDNAMTSINYRGPDRSRTLVLENAILGHKRLSIIDLDDRSDQPFSEKGIHLLYNGEIYNYELLKKELTGQHPLDFTTSGDTEVLFQGVQADPEFLKKVDGMYAFCVFDEHQKKITISRDLFGQKPLFYGYDAEGSLVVASELRCILNFFDPEDLEINENAFQGYLKFGASIAPQTFYKNLYQLLPGETREFSWSPRDQAFSSASSTKLEWQTSATRTKVRLPDLISDRMQSCFVSDTPIAVLASGGVDSSALLQAIPDIQTEQTIAIHLKTKEDPAAFEIVKDMLPRNLPLVIVEYGEQGETDNRKHALSLITRFGEPFSDSSYLYSAELYAAIPQKYKTIIGGDGADEIFRGYKPAPYVFLAAAVTGIVPVAIRRLVLSRIRRNTNIRLPLGVLFGSIESLEKLLTGFSALEISLLTNTSGGRSSKWDEKLLSGREVIRFYQDYLETRLSNVFLRKSDHASMVCSKELRSPFLQGNPQELRRLSKLPMALIPKIALKLFVSATISPVKAFRKKVGFDIVADENLNNRKQSLIAWSSKNSKVLENYFNLLQLEKTITNASREAHLLRLEVLLHWLQERKKNDF